MAYYAYLKDGSGYPTAGSNKSYETRALVPSNYTVISAIINAPLGTNPQFHITNKYFIEFDDTTGIPIDETLVVATSTPSGDFLELFSNNILTIPNTPGTTTSGSIPDSRADISRIPLVVSQRFKKFGNRKVNNKYFNQ